LDDITNAQIKALVTFDATTDVITIGGGTDDALHKAAIGTHTINFSVVSQTDATLTGLKYVVTLTFDHTECATFVWHFSDSSKATYTDATATKINIDTQSYPLAFAFPTIVTSTGATTNCKYNWQSSITIVDNTFTLASSFTTSFATDGKASFTAYTANSNPWGRHSFTQVAKNL
jgi:hypothetical protein